MILYSYMDELEWSVWVRGAHAGQKASDSMSKIRVNFIVNITKYTKDSEYMANDRN